MNRNPALQAEIAFRLANGGRLLTVKAMAAEFAALGYEFDRAMDCRSIARYLHDGRTYPSCTTSVREADSGFSFANVNARRDSNFRKLQDLRSEIFAISRGAILEV